jgi:hypothetical protein
MATPTAIDQQLIDVNPITADQIARLNGCYHARVAEAVSRLLGNNIEVGLRASTRPLS